MLFTEINAAADAARRSIDVDYFLPVTDQSHSDGVVATSGGFSVRG